MTVNYAKHYNKKQTPQSEKIPGEKQVANNAGGYVYEVDKWQRLARFLILGTDGGTYYVSERKLTRENAQVVEACLATDGGRTIAEIIEISQTGRAPKNDQAVFALALAASVQVPDASGVSAESIRSMALDALPKVCRIPTHLFQFMTAIKAMRGSSRMLRRALGEWYSQWDANKLAYELVKYQSREGWANRDVLRLAHPKMSAEHQAVVRWAVCGHEAAASPGPREVKRAKEDTRTSRIYQPVADVPNIIAAFELAKTKPPVELLVRLIREHGLTREMLPTECLNEVAVWEALLEKMPLTAMIRNLGKMSSLGIFEPLKSSAWSKHVVERITSQENLRKSRVHPLFILNAMKTYAQGHGDKGSLKWTPAAKIVDALDAAFYEAFGNVEPTGKNVMLALDVSGSMGSLIGGTSLSCREACAALALVTQAVEDNVQIVGFTNGGSVARRSQWGGYLSGISPLKISKRQRLDDVVKYIAGLNFGGTDCALPMIYAESEKLDVDGFVVYTDNETWAGDIHPSQALRSYRAKQNKPEAAQVVVGMTASGFTIASPDDPRTLDVVGFDLATPTAISAFIKG